jgi:tRNA-2-methylthio-N6-dimethylallyladenosine synthase
MTAHKTYYIITYGCQMNKNDSERLAGMLEFQGLKPAGTMETANLVILNTCSVREKAERRVLGKLHELNHLRKKNGLKMELGITGCMPKRDMSYIKKELPFVEHVIDIEDVRQYPPKRSHTDQAWVTIMYGCDNYCSYCIVPYVRGRERSRPLDDILQEISEIDLTRFPKLMLLGQNVNSYKSGKLKTDDLPPATCHLPHIIDFAELLKLIHEIPAIQQIDFLTSHPKDMSDKLIGTIAGLPKISRELHFPLQAGNDRILHLMNRGYTYAHYRELVGKIREQIPEVKISTDLIVGFPSETAEEFGDTIRAVHELQFSRVITTAFSPRPGTKAAELAGQLPVQVRAERLQKLMVEVDKLENLTASLSKG